MSYLLGIDLGGTKIEGVVLRSKHSLDVMSRKRIPTEKEKGYDHIISRIISLVLDLEKEVGHEFEYIGIGTPGSIDSRSNLMKNSNTTCLNNMPFHKDLEDRIGKEVRMANDANCCAIAEAQFGAVKDVVPDAEVVFGVIMGTGVGGGVVVNGKIINGANGVGGEWGHMHLDDSGGKCYCGLIGCAETVISGPHLERWYESVAGKKKSLKEIVTDYREETDVYAKMTMERLLDRFGQGISTIINILDPDAIVIGGGVGNIDELYTLGVEKARHYAFNDYLNTKFLKPKLGDSAGVYGAALL